MHVLIAFITAVVTLLYALERLGVDLGWLNPWAWRRRRRWLRQLSVNPAFNLTEPMEAVALLLLATAKIDGDLSAEEKAELREIFQTDFHQSSGEASSLLNSSAFILDSGEAVFANPQNVLEKNLARFSQDQKQSSLALLQRVAELGGSPSEVQTDFIARVRAALYEDQRKASW